MTTARDGDGIGEQRDEAEGPTTEAEEPGNDASEPADNGGEPSELRRAYRLLVIGVRWLREFNRGHAGTSHLPNREK